MLWARQQIPAGIDPPGMWVLGGKLGKLEAVCEKMLLLRRRNQLCAQRHNLKVWRQGGSFDSSKTLDARKTKGSSSKTRMGKGWRGRWELSPNGPKSALTPLPEDRLWEDKEGGKTSSFHPTPNISFGPE